MQLNYSENSFAEYATVLMWRDRGKKLFCLAQVFLRVLTNMEKTGPSPVYLKPNTFFLCVLDVPQLPEHKGIHLGDFPTHCPSGL